MAVTAERVNRARIFETHVAQCGSVRKFIKLTVRVKCGGKGVLVVVGDTPLFTAVCLGGYGGALLRGALMGGAVSATACVRRSGCRYARGRMTSGFLKSGDLGFA